MIFTLSLVAASQIEVEIVGGGVEPIYIVDEPQSVFPSGLNELMSMVERMQPHPPQQFQMVQNPCSNDQVRLRCGPDAACLKAHLSQLAPSCASLLLKNTEEARPSPSPAPMASGFYSETHLGQDGQVHTETGTLSSRDGQKLQGEMQNMMDRVMSEFFGQPPVLRKPLAAPPPRPSQGAHPCEDGVRMCKQELNGVNTHASMQQCLVKRYAQLSSECKCFLHQVMGEELERAVPAAKSSSELRVPAVVFAEGHVKGSLGAEPFMMLRHEKGPPAPPGHHRITCALFMMLFFLSVALVLRRLCFCCVTPKPRFAAVVPPQQPVQMTIEPLVAKIATAKM
jgi:hypothetical protein